MSTRSDDRVYRIDSVAATSLDSIDRLCDAQIPRVLVLDVDLIEPLDTDALRRLRRRLPATDWLLGWDQPTPCGCALAIRSHVHGCIEWERSSEQLAPALDAVLAGELWFARRVLQSLYLALLEPCAPGSAPAEAQPCADVLTSREAEVLACMRRGMTNKQIAQRLEISINTVKKHLAHVYVKRGLHNGRQTFA